MLGTCGGFQHMALEFARNAAGIAGAAHAEIRAGRRDDRGRELACSLVGEERTVTAGGGNAGGRDLRDEPFPASTSAATGSCRASRSGSRRGLVVGAHAEDAGVEAFELPDHPFYLATLFQPQVGGSERGTLHPLSMVLTAAAERGAMLPR